MKKIAKKIAKNTPGVKALIYQIVSIQQKLDVQQQQLNQLSAELHRGDNRITQLQNLLAEVEHYQPTYHIAGLVNQPQRDSHDRCIAIEAALIPLAGKRILDIGSSLGYVSFYMADRGAVVQGWESNAKNAEVSRLVRDINGIPVDFRTKEFNNETVATIPNGEFDVAIMLSVIHHITRFQGLDYSQKLMKALMDRVPVLVVELAKKGEDPKLPWDAAQPEDELAVFDLIKKDIEIQEIGRFSNHLSDNKRPLYLVKRKQVLSINSREYAFDNVSNVAYKNARVAYDIVQRRYYFSKRAVIKEYVLDKGGATHTTGQILNEIQLLTNLQAEKIYHFPKLLDYEVKKDRVFVALERIPGVLLHDLKSINEELLRKITKDVLKTLSDLEARGISHNDVRQWNILVDKKGSAWLIDYGLSGAIKKEDDVQSLLNAVVAAYKGEKFSYNLKDRKVKELAKELPDEWGATKQYLTKAKKPTAAEVLKTLA